MKISYDVKKFKANQWRGVVAHHERVGARPDSQIRDKSLWLSGQGMHVLKPLDRAMLERANSMPGTQVGGKAVRKDAVVMLGVHLQLGHSELWRDEAGNPRPASQRPPLAKLAKHALAVAEQLYGAANVAGAVLHTDETAPHVEVYVVPMHQGRLNAKHFVGGPADLKAQWQRVYQSFKSAGFDVTAPDTGAGLGGAPLDGLAGRAGLIRSATAVVKNGVLQHQLRRASTENAQLSRIVTAKQRLIIRQRKDIRELTRENQQLRSENAGLRLEVESASARAMDWAREKVASYEATIRQLRGELAQMQATITQRIREGVAALLGKESGGNGPSGPGV